MDPGQVQPQVANLVVKMINKKLIDGANKAAIDILHGPSPNIDVGCCDGQVPVSLRLLSAARVLDWHGDLLSRIRLGLLSGLNAHAGCLGSAVIAQTWPWMLTLVRGFTSEPDDPRSELHTFENKS